MTEFSSISFSQCSQDDVPLTSRYASVELNNMLARLGETLSEVKELNGVSVDLYKTMVDLVRQSQQKLTEIKKQNQQAHKKSLQHIEILLFQKDYAEALQKIDQYKKMQLTDLFFQNSIIENIDCNSENQLTFQQEKKLIQSQFTHLDLKQKIWLKYALATQETDQSLTHVSYEEIQQSLLQHFRKQFDIESEMTQVYEQRNLATPEKKNSKSISYLKSSAKNHKHSNFGKTKQHEQSAGKIQSSKKRSSQKRTTRKKANGEAQENKTSKKLTPFIA